MENNDFVVCDAWMILLDSHFLMYHMYKLFKHLSPYPSVLQTASIFESKAVFEYNPLSRIVQQSRQDSAKTQIWLPPMFAEKKMTKINEWFHLSRLEFKLFLKLTNDIFKCVQFILLVLKK